MLNLNKRLKESFPFLHQRSATETDFYEFCALNDIDVVYTELISFGAYVIFDSKHFIFLNDKLRGWLKRYVMYHELAHYLFHFPSQSRYGVEFFTVHAKKKNHREAEAAAALLLLPPCEMHMALQDLDFAECGEV